MAHPAIPGNATGILRKQSAVVPEAARNPFEDLILLLMPCRRPEPLQRFISLTSQ
jgi:hypothetical protein